MTISFGHGMAFSPLQAGSAVAALVNGGLFHRPRLTKNSNESSVETRVISPQTSAHMRYLLQQDVISGSGQNAAVPGLTVGGKSGTSEKVVNGKYDANRLFASFIGVFPIHDPRYLVMTGLDEPKANKDTHGFATAGWNAAPFAGDIIRRVAPIMGVSSKSQSADDFTTSSVSKY
jgi:cell division protein FtsI (penicillin-binding protein 3)